MPRPYIKLKLWPTISNHARKPDPLSTSQICKVRLSLAKKKKKKTKTRKPSNNPCNDHNWL